MKLTEEHKLHISQALKGKQPPKESPVNLSLGPAKRQKRIKMLDFNGNEIRVFESLVTAQKHLNKSSDNCIRNALKGRAEHAYGYKWEYC